jgi:hypothetical protein
MTSPRRISLWSALSGRRPGADSQSCSCPANWDRADIGTFLKKVAVVITSRIGGTSGPIWGTAVPARGRDGGRREIEGLLAAASEIAIGTF